MLKISSFLFSLLLVSCSTTETVKVTNNYGAFSKYLLDEIGGKKYTYNIFNPTKRVSTKNQLLSALKKAKPGDVIYINDNSIINLTGVWKVRIPSGVTLASGRGINNSVSKLPKGLILAPILQPMILA